MARLRIARPVTDLARSKAMYRDGLGLEVLGAFEGHDGFDGVMLGRPGADCHFEFTFCHGHPVKPNPTPEDLVVFYVPDEAAWKAACARMIATGFREVEPFNPYWAAKGRTFQDADGYRTVLQNGAWGEAND
jgi:catechol 2,3-dioxygenase-like lactoylglutathione lyase family enzyme